MSFTEFAAGVGTYGVFILVIAVTVAIAALIPLAIGRVLGQRKLAVYSFIATALSALAFGPLVGILIFLLCVVILFVSAVRARKQGRSSDHEA
jgi:heme exporter protein D